jgi:tRNA-splicing ligase RtcB
MKVISSEKLPIKMWLEEIEDGAVKQLTNLANLPFAFKHIAVMPDCHQGYGMPIGGVLATTGVIIPNAVGVDIGCGMCAVRTSIKTSDINPDLIKKIFGGIRSAVPVGFNHQSSKQDESLMPSSTPMEGGISKQEYTSALKQIGTLGGGNHFIEIQKGSDGFVWIMIHSGSRNIGFKVAKYYNDMAINLNEKWHSSVPKEHELAFLPLDSIQGKQYIEEMEYCVEFAFCNRRLMMDRIKEEVYKQTQCEFEPMINIAHNYARMEHHFGKNVMVHRKGATSAKEGEIGIIPGSQGTKSYIVRGKGNEESFQSCSHGAGRKMGRKQASRELNLEEEKRKLDERRIVHSVRTVSDLDEASGAYKDIDVVMKNQAELVDIVVELEPLGVIKG